MLVKKADDYQSWYIEEDGYGILIDPWLDKTLNPYNSLLLQRKRTKGHYLDEKELNKVKFIIVTAPFIDHFHLPSLISLGPEIQLISTVKVGKMAKKKGLKNKFIDYRNISEIGSLKFTALKAGFPYSQSTFSFKLENEQGKSLFHEGHVVNLKEIKNRKINTDIAIITTESVKFLGILSLSMNQSKAKDALKLLGSKILLSTGTRPSKTKGLINIFLSFNSDKKKFLKIGVEKLINKPGEKVEV